MMNTLLSDNHGGDINNNNNNIINNNNNNNNNNNIGIDMHPPVFNSNDALSEQGLHQLDCSWTIWVIDPTTQSPMKPLTSSTSSSHDDYLSSMDKIGTFDTVEEFWTCFRKLKPPSKMPIGATYHLFKTGIVPIWEDEHNKEGGKWVMQFQGYNRSLYNTDLIWENIVLGIVGETIDTERDICGVVLTKRDKLERIQIWNRDAHNKAGVDSLRSNILNTLYGLNVQKLMLRYQVHSMNNSQKGVDNSEAS
ncbi:hypothetical protein SAMD00019534_004580, partial [Acytostelium subglobosum LB1]|uniref:hypothetical protein n=1 Tax=Acytostelium subglobosum LB1 TaxID=1410327 RepID=UPI000644F312